MTGMPELEEQPLPLRTKIPKPHDADTRARNGTGEHADEAQLGVTNEEVEDLENDAEGG